MDCTIDGAKVWRKQGRKEAKNERTKQDSRGTSKHNGGEVRKNDVSGFRNDPVVSGFFDPRRELAGP